MNAKLKTTSTAILAVIFTLSSVALQILVGQKANLTGLGWLEGHFLLTLLFLIFGLGLLFFQTWIWILQTGQKSQQKILLASIALSAIGYLTPYTKADAASALNDAHTWICLAGIGLCLWIWCRPLLPISFSTTYEKKQAAILLIPAVAALLVFCWQGQVTLLCELVFLNGQIWALFLVNHANRNQ